MANTSIWPQVVTWLLVVGGWTIINHQNNTREARKELRSLLDKINAEAADLESRAILFHTSDYDEHLASDLLRRIKRLASRVRYTSLLKGRECIKVAELRQAITLQNFDKSSHSKLNHSDQIIQNIVDAEHELLTVLEELFANKFRTKPWVVF